MQRTSASRELVPAAERGLYETPTDGLGAILDLEFPALGAALRLNLKSRIPGGRPSHHALHSHSRASFASDGHWQPAPTLKGGPSGFQRFVAMNKRSELPKLLFLVLVVFTLTGCENRTPVGVNKEQTVNSQPSVVNARGPSAAEAEAFLHAQRGYKHFSENEHRLAIEEFEKAIALNPDVAVFYAALADAYRKVSKKNAKAKEALEQAVALDSSNHEYRYNLGVCYLDAHEPAAAEKQFEAVQRLSPNFRRVHLLLGEACAGQDGSPEKFEKAIKEFRKAIAQYPNDPNAHFQLGGVYQSLGRLEDAAAEYEKAARLDEENHLCRYKLAVVLQRLGRMEEAREQLAEYKRLYDKRMKERRESHGNEGSAAEEKVEQEEKHELATSRSRKSGLGRRENEAMGTDRNRKGEKQGR